MSARDLPGTAYGSNSLSAEAHALYLRIIKDLGGTVKIDSEISGAALDELVSLGLLVHDTDHAGNLVAIDPSQLASTLSIRWQRQALDLLSRAVSIPSELTELADAFHSPEQSGGAIEYVRGQALINQRLQQITAAGITEAVAMQPGGPRPPELLAGSLEGDLKSVRRGTAMRTIYHASTRYHQSTRDYVATLSAEGWQFRTLDEPYTRLIIIDRKVAVLPSVEDINNFATFIHDQSVVNFLQEEVFERNWTRALDFDGERNVPQEVVSRLRQTIVDLLLAGTNHRVIARRLGISERTLARHLAEMREDYNVDSLFQLGYALGRSATSTTEIAEE
ncbi:helix-turn-helix domain-containing protein [Kitasatospora sp. NA04385]|uniref:helix-turn-helix domain-containing protein n=1 Tax=Kitasatospora sp. NA04385 TaxID=2742135 RepID=UPI00158FF82A|nr:helix-turn-helix domain-containing protein [Kitasatospora sp. NA04385]QKW20673.1 helix-turn-helix domain-containing protein [Kitasatospora sp. NA04385]